MRTTATYKTSIHKSQLLTFNIAFVTDQTDYNLFDTYGGVDISDKTIDIELEPDTDSILFTVTYTFDTTVPLEPDDADYACLTNLADSINDAYYKPLTDRVDRLRDLLMTPCDGEDLPEVEPCTDADNYVIITARKHGVAEWDEYDLTHFSARVTRIVQSRRNAKIFHTEEGNK